MSLAPELLVAPNSPRPLAAFTLACFSRSAQRLGGDCYEVLPGKAGAFWLIIADVMGKGQSAAPFAARLHTEARRFATEAKGPAAFLASVNRELFAELSAADLFITAQAALVEPGRGLATVANAGHCPLLLGRETVRPVAPEGFPLGILSSSEYAEARVLLGSSFCALLYSDGITEARNPQGFMFGQERLERWLAEHAGQGLSAGMLAASLRCTLREFQRGQPPTDDQTFLLLAGTKTL